MNCGHKLHSDSPLIKKSLKIHSLKGFPVSPGFLVSDVVRQDQDAYGGYERTSASDRRVEDLTTGGTRCANARNFLGSQVAYAPVLQADLLSFELQSGGVAFWHGNVHPEGQVDLGVELTTVEKQGPGLDATHGYVTGVWYVQGSRQRSRVVYVD